jgi:arginyl-tRNA synthetase
MFIKKQLEEELKKVFKTLNFDEELAAVSASSQADYQCNAPFALAKRIGKSPASIAVEICAEMNKSSTLAKFEPSGAGFVNITLKNDAILSFANEIFSTGKLPLVRSQLGQTVFFDYGGANIAKELHIGHLRSAIIGEAIKRVYRELGADTISDVYLGDWGLQFGLIITQAEDEGILEILGDEVRYYKEITLELLNEIYPRASKRKNDDKEFYARAEKATVLLQSKTPTYFSVWKKIREISLVAIKRNYENLNCEFDIWGGESAAQDFIPRVLAELCLKGLTRTSDGAVIMDVAGEGEHILGEDGKYKNPMPPIILKKHNGGALYATNDVATIFARYKEFKPDKFVYVVDARQDLHFNQVFRCVKKAGFVSAGTQLVHIPYGTINGKDGKPFKTRSGDTIKLEDIINLVADEAEKRLEKAGDRETAQKIGLSALKFADLSNNVRKDYIFDIEKCISFEGKTGPYLLYTVARINSILAKNAIEQSKGFGEILKLDDEIRAIIVAVLRICEAIQNAAETLTLNNICDAVYVLAQNFSAFYATHNIQNEKDAALKNDWLSVCALTKTAITEALNVLAIDTVERM